jgi:glutamate synthase domain-containing protein 3
MANHDMVSLESPDKPEDIELLRRMLENHVRFTDSPIAKAILTDWENELRRFVKVMPNDYRRVLEKQAEIEEQARKLAQRQTAGA